MVVVDNQTMKVLQKIPVGAVPKRNTSGTPRTDQGSLQLDDPALNSDNNGLGPVMDVEPRRIILTCHFTVPRVMFSASAISWLLRPFTISRRMSISRGLRTERIVFRSTLLRMLRRK